MGHNTTGERLRAARTARSLTQEQLARACGVTVTTVNRWENNRSALTIDNARVVADALGVAPEWVAFGRGEGPRVVSAVA